MAVNFYPNREQMIREVEQCVTSSMMEVLLSFCKCCVYKVFDESMLLSECRMCSVKQGITKISKNQKRHDSPDMEYLGVC